MRTIRIRPSSNIAFVEYDDETKRLQVSFQSGSTYEYEGVPANIANGFETAASPGRYFNALVKDIYLGTEI